MYSIGHEMRSCCGWSSTQPRSGYAPVTALNNFPIAAHDVYAQFGFNITMAAPEWLGQRVESNPTMKVLFTTFALGLAMMARAASLAPVVEIEEDVYSFTNANNGAGPMWCSGSTSLVRVGKRIFASGLETVPEAKPYNNCRWMLFERRAKGWERVWVDENGRTREPSPLAAFADGRVFLSANPTTLGSVAETNRGPAQPEVFQFKAGNSKATPKKLKPKWQVATNFTAHSYRSFAADGAAGEFVLFQNVGYTHSEWTFLDRHGKWSAQAQLKWPWGAEYDKPQPARVCYPNVAIQNRAVHFCGVSDIVEPYNAWREFKLQITGQPWDYDFRRLFYTWTPDITKQPFAEWVEIASRDKTCGWIMPGDLYVARDGDVHVTWMERAIDERLREKFFPDARQTNSLRYAVVHEGKVILRRTIEESTEDKPGISGAWPRLQPTPDHRLFVFYYAGGVGADGKPVSENRVREILSEGKMTPAVRVPLQMPFHSYFTATVRGGSPPSRTLELLGNQGSKGNTLSYARIRLY